MSAPDPGTRFAAFDIGTNTVLMTVAERGPDGRFSPVLERLELTRLGEGVNRTGVLSEAAIERTVEAIARFADEARKAGATELVAGATSAARDASNREAFLERVRQRAGVEVELLPGEVEARLTFRAVQEDFGPGAAQLVALDIGGGSTELVVGPSRGDATFRQSVNVGSVRMTERFVTTHPIPQGELEAMRAFIRAAMRNWPRAPEGSEVVAVAATATSLYALRAGLPSAEDPRVQGGRLEVSALEPLLARLSAMSLEERRAVPGLNPKRADVICAGGYVLLEALRHLGVDSCRVSDRGVRWGLLWERFKDA